MSIKYYNQIDTFVIQKNFGSLLQLFYPHFYLD